MWDLLYKTKFQNKEMTSELKKWKQKKKRKRSRGIPYY